MDANADQARGSRLLLSARERDSQRGSGISAGHFGADLCLDRSFCVRGHQTAVRGKCLALRRRSSDGPIKLEHAKDVGLDLLPWQPAISALYPKS